MIRVLEMMSDPIRCGGIESMLLNMLSTFDIKNECNFDIFTPYSCNNEQLVDFMKFNNGNIFALGLPFKINYKFFKYNNIINIFFKTHNFYDVVHIHSVSLSSMYIFAKNAKKHGIRKVFVHSHIANTNVGILAKIRKYIFGILMKPYIDDYFGCSIGAIENKFIINPSTSIVVNNGIDIDKFTFSLIDRNFIRDKFHLNEKFVVGSLGRIDFQKNNKFMIDIISHLHQYNDIIMLIVGDGCDLDELRSYVKSKDLENQIIFAGNQINTSMFYSAFDVFILPSIFEGLPVTSIEAQVSGLPCLISENVDKECSISNGTFFLPIDNAKVWANYILKIKENISGLYNRNSFIIDFDKFDRNKTFNVVREIYLN